MVKDFTPKDYMKISKYIEDMNLKILLKKSVKILFENICYIFREQKICHFIPYPEILTFL